MRGEQQNQHISEQLAAKRRAPCQKSKADATAARCATRWRWIPRTYACHCRDGQTWSGSAFSQQTFLPEAALSVTGPLVIYEMTYSSGRVSAQRMCGVCHTRIYNTNSARPGVVVVRAGTLDRNDDLEVVAHIWMKRTQPRLTLPAGVPAWPEGAPPAELLQALRSQRDTSL